ncbi:MAG: GNAT family N-acetyltransferase [Bacteroidia bacterium]
MRIRLETERLYLREFTLEDASCLFDMHQDPEILRYTGDPFPWDSIQATQNILSEIILPQYKNGMGRWAVHLKSDNQFIGWCGLKDTGNEIDLGYRFLKVYWGKGYATEAARAVLDFGNRLHLPNIIGRAAEENKASLRVLEKIGMKFPEKYTDPDSGRLSVKYRNSFQ